MLDQRTAGPTDVQSLIDLLSATKNPLLFGPFRLVAFSTRVGKYGIASVRACIYVLWVCVFVCVRECVRACVCASASVFART